MIVDDEPLAREILEDFVGKTPGCEIAASCKNAIEAFTVLSRQPVDLLLLDIDMPEISGIELLQTLKQAPPVIFTTAYSQFALESYDHNAIDYLLKPIAFSRFLKAIDKVRDNVQHLKANTGMANAADSASPNSLFVKSDGKLVKISLDQLLFVEGLKDYLKLWTETGNLVIYGTMKHIEEQLTKRSDFMRVNKSYIVNMALIREVEGNLIRIKEHEIPIGNTYLNEVQEALNKLKLM